jgi:hypothetical protein
VPMATTAQKDWIKDFGLQDRRPPHLFTHGKRALCVVWASAVV